MENYKHNLSYVCSMFLFFMKPSTMLFLTVRMLFQSIEHTVWQLEIKLRTAHISSSKPWWKLQNQMQTQQDCSFLVSDCPGDSAPEKDYHW